MSDSIDQSKVTPPKSLAYQWEREWVDNSLPEAKGVNLSEYISFKASRWGADKALERCCEYVGNDYCMQEGLRNAVYPSKPLMTNLSQSAQAVLDAVEDDCIHPDDIHRIAAAALRAAADEVVPEVANDVGDEHEDATDEARRDQCLCIRYKFLAIAAELEGGND